MKRKIFSLIGLLSFVLGSSVLHAMISDRDLQIHFGITSASEEHRTFWRALLDGDDALMRQYCDSLVSSGRTAQEEELIWGQLSDFMDTPTRGGDTPLMIAVRKHNLPLVQVLKDYGASSCLRNHRDQSAYDMALAALEDPRNREKVDSLEQIRHLVGFAGGGGSAIQEEPIAVRGDSAREELPAVSISLQTSKKRKRVRFVERLNPVLVPANSSDSEGLSPAPHPLAPSRLVDCCSAQEAADFCDTIF